MKNLTEIFRLPKWAKISLVALSAIAVVLLVAVFALQSWADNQVESANLTFSKIDKAKSADLESGYAYEARVHFPRLDFLLRSSTISRINLVEVAWAGGIDLNMIRSVESQKRRLFFTTTQQLSLDSGANLGIMSYKMDFSPFGKAIIKYYITLIALFVLAIFFYNAFRDEIDSLCCRFIEMLKAESLPNVLWQSYKSINPLYRHTFWIVFIACNIVFGFDTIYFLWGNHDWSAVFYGWGMFGNVWEGRYTMNIVSMLLQGEKLLPILNNILAFLGLSLASVWLCMYLNIQRKLWIWAIIGFMLTLQPFTLVKMYYAFQVAGLFIAVAIGILGFVLAKKAGEYSANAQIGGGGNHTPNSPTHKNLKPYALCLLSVFCIHWGIASFQPFIDTALILLCGGIITLIIDTQGNVKTSLYKSRFLIIAVALSAISHKIILDILKKIGKTQEFYNNQMTPFSEMPEHIILAIKLGFGNLVNYNITFMPLYMTILFAIFLVAFLIFLFKSKLQIGVKVSIFILLCGAILASQTHIIISKTIAPDPRIEYYGLMFLRVLFVALAFKICTNFIQSQKIAQNLLFVVSAIVIWICVVQDLYAQKLQKLANDAELTMLNRVIDRIEQDENFNPNKKYCGLWFGDMPNFRERYYNKSVEKNNELISVTFITWATGSFDKFMSSDVFKDCGFLSAKDKQFQTTIKRLHKAEILDKLQPFPHKNSVIVFEDIIVFVASRGNLDEIRQMAKDLP